MENHTMVAEQVRLGCGRRGGPANVTRWKHKVGFHIPEPQDREGVGRLCNGPTQVQGIPPKNANSGERHNSTSSAHRTFVDPLTSTTIAPFTPPVPKPALASNFGPHHTRGIDLFAASDSFPRPQVGFFVVLTKDTYSLPQVNSTAPPLPQKILDIFAIAFSPRLQLGVATEPVHICIAVTPDLQHQFLVLRGPLEYQGAHNSICKTPSNRPWPAQQVQAWRVAGSGLAVDRCCLPL